MRPIQDWKAFFNAHAPHYDQNPFAQHTVAEIDFFLGLFPLHPGSHVLDIGCGTGRHSIELAKRGYKVTGIDLSEAMLEIAISKAGKLPIRFLPQDAANDYDLGQQFDAAICLCEGGFGLIGAEDDPEVHDRAILRGIAKHLKPAAPFLLTALNGYSIIRQMKDELVTEGRFNPATMVAHYEDQMDLPEGPQIITIRERLFIPPEIVTMLRAEGFRCDYVFGGTAGQWGQRPVALDEIEAMFVCRRSNE
jgi:SAM-dependent methyltransferase